MGILNRGIERWTENRKADELARFVAKLQSMTAREIGLAFAIATHWRNSLVLQRELMDPIYYVSANPQVCLEFERIIAKLQQAGESLDALGLGVWLHTLRAAENEQLRSQAREMWRELEKGFPFTRESAIAYRRRTGIALRAEYSELYPVGFSPQPRESSHTNALRNAVSHGPAHKSFDLNYRNTF